VTLLFGCCWSDLQHENPVVKLASKAAAEGGCEPQSAKTNVITILKADIGGKFSSKII